jgi:hypothetical protein
MGVDDNVAPVLPIRITRECTATIPLAEKKELVFVYSLAKLLNGLRRMVQR